MDILGRSKFQAGTGGSVVVTFFKDPIRWKIIIF